MKRALLVAAALGCGFILARLLVPSIVERQLNHVLQSVPATPPQNPKRCTAPSFVADLHADTLLSGRTRLKPSQAGNIDVPRMLAGNVALRALTKFSASCAT